EGARICAAGTGAEALAIGAKATASAGSGAGWARSGAGSGGRAAAAATSSFRIWPRRPEPGTSAACIPFSSIILRAAGAGGISLLALGADLGAEVGADLAGTSPASAGVSMSRVGGRPEGGTRDGTASLSVRSSVLAGALPAPSLIDPSTEPTATVAPCGTLISASTPAAGAGTSSVTLSVSSSTRGSSTLTASPGFLNHWPTVASVTDSPSAGTMIWIAIAFHHLTRQAPAWPAPSAPG